jgi:hypothetical protein
MATGRAEGWPTLAGIDLQPTIEALHLWSQVVGKTRLMLTPWINHSWHVTLYLSARGLTTGQIHAPQANARTNVTLDMAFDLIADALVISDTEGRERRIALGPLSVADFHAATMQSLAELGVSVDLHCMPCEIPGAIDFTDDHAPRAYDGAVARRYWRALVQVHRVLQLFRSRFVGKCSPIHLFWGSFDLAVTRFSGRGAPRHEGGAPHTPEAVMREAYSQEVSSAGFWPGGDGAPPSFYSYAYPAPHGFGDARVGPAAAGFDQTLGEFLLPYEAVRTAPDPDAALLEFLQTTYEAAADLAKWDRSRLEVPTGPYGHPPKGLWDA